MMLGDASQVTLAPCPPYCPASVGSGMPPLPATPVAAPPLTWSDIDPYVAQFASNVSRLSQWSDDGVTTACSWCADPVAVVSRYQSQTGVSLSAGMTPTSVVSHYASQINGWCSTIRAEATKRGITAPCGASGSGFSLSGISPILLVGGALLAAALLMGGN